MTPQDQIYSVPTNLGLAKMAYAQANGLSVNITHMAIGDGNGALVSPDATWPGLAREVHRAQLNQLYQHDQNPNWLVAELVLPAEVGGWTIREIALYDAAGDLIYIGNHAEQYKPIQSQGSDETKTIRMVILVSNTSTVTLKTDPTTVLATVDYVQREFAKLDYKQSARFATKGNISLQGLGVQAGGDWSAALTAGDRVFVRSQTSAKENGIYIAAGGVWVRASDADASVEVTAGLVISVEQGATLADTIWQLITDNPIVIGTTELTFRDITDGFARLLSPTFVGTPTAPTPAQFNNSLSLMTTAFAKRMGVEFSGLNSISATTALTNAYVGGVVSAASAAAINVTLPPTAGVPHGAMILLANAGTGAATLLGSGADLTTSQSGSTVSIVLGLGDTALLVKVTGEWRLEGGSVALKYAAVMAGANWTTQPQHANDKSFATTEFVKRSGLTFGAIESTVGARTMTPADAGKLFVIGSTAPITLPLASSMPQGSVITFFIYSAGYVPTFVRSGADVFSAGVGNITSYTPKSTGYITFVNETSGIWEITGCGALDQLSGFGATFTANGRQKLPSGLIEQWVTGSSDANGVMSLALPQQFPNGILGGMANEANPGAWGSTSVSVWAFDLAASSLSTAVARVRSIVGAGGPVVGNGIAGRIRVWGY